jgi:hypothetical protein
MKRTSCGENSGNGDPDGFVGAELAHRLARSTGLNDRRLGQGRRA